MACDLKIEIFSHKLFHKLWYDMGEIENIPDILEIYRDECVVNDTYLEACDDMFFKAVYCRSNLIAEIYMSSVSDEEIKNFKTLPEVYDYVVRMCDRDDLFGHLTVFDRMLATSEFVANICFLTHSKTDSRIDVLRYGHILWSMYFDKFAKEFYEKGGWSKLKREVKCYELLSEFETIFYGCSNSYLQAIKEAAVNFCHFKNAINYQEQKHQHPVHISVRWIQFRIEHFESYINIPLSYEDSVNAYEADQLLRDLKLLLHSTNCKSGNLEVSRHQSSKFSTKISYSEINSALGKRKANQDNETQIQYSGFEHEVKRIDEVSDEFPHVCQNFKESQIGCQTSTTEELAFDITSPKENFGLVENTFTEMEHTRQTSKSDDKYSYNEHILIVDMKRPSKTITENASEIANFDLIRSSRGKPHMNKNEDGNFEYFYEGNAEERDEIINTDEVISIFQTEGTKCQRMCFPKSYTNCCDLGSRNEIVSSINEMENCKGIIATSLCSNNGQIEIVKSMDDSSIRNAEKQDGIINTDDLNSIFQVEETKCHRMCSPKNRANSRDLDSTNKIVSNGNKMKNCKEMRKRGLCSQNGQTEIVKSKDDSSSRKITAHERNGKTIPEVLPAGQNFSSVNKNINIDDEISRNRIARKELRKEQNDQEVKKFLRMLLVLGDMEGTEFVLATLQNIEGPKNAQESSTKQQKKPNTKTTPYELSASKNNKEYPEKSEESLNLPKKRSKKKRSKKKV